MITETLAGIALVKSAVDAIKSGINTAKDVGEIAGHIDNLFEGEKQIQKDRSDAANNTLSLKSVAEETINAKLAQEKMDEMRTLVDLRFGHGTWQSIVTERARRIQAEKDRAKEIRLARIKKQKQLQADIEQFVIIAGSILGGALILFGLLWFIL